MCCKNLILSHHEERKNFWSIEIFFDEGLRSFQNIISMKLWWNRWGLDSGPARGGNSSVSENVMTQQNYAEI